MQLPQNTLPKKSTPHSPKQHASPSPRPPPLLALPPELHLLITHHLPYPDALALKHTHPRFYALTDTTVRLKVAWLLERKRRNLEWPQENKCIMRTDAAFCSGGQVRRIMAKRRAHGECGKGEGGCEVVVGASCGGVRGVGKGSGVGRLWGGWR